MKTIPDNTVVIGLARKSSVGDERQQDSIPSQVKQIKNFIENYHLIPEQISGGNWDNGILKREGSALDLVREDIQEIIDGRASNRIKADYLVITAIDRLVRDQILDLAEKLALFRDTELKIVLCQYGNQYFDLHDPMDVELLVGFAKAAAAYVESLASNVIRGLYHRADTLKTPPMEMFGFKVTWEDDRSSYEIVTNKEQLDAIQKAGREYGDGRPKTQIVRELNEAGFVTPKRKTRGGVPWTITTLERCLINPIYTGDYVRFSTKYGKLKSVGQGGIGETYNKFKKRSRQGPTVGKGFQEHREPLVKKENAFPELAIFTRDEHEKILTRYHTKSAKRSASASRTWPFSGKAFCGHCGCAIRGFVTSLGVRRYECEAHRYKPGENICPNRKAVDEFDLFYNVFLEYYAACMREPERILEAVRTKRDSMSRGPEYLDKEAKVRSLAAHYAQKLENGDYEVAEAIEKRLSALKKEMSAFESQHKFEIPRYSYDYFSLTSPLIAAMSDESEIDELRHYARSMFSNLQGIRLDENGEIESSGNEVIFPKQPTVPLIDDVVEKITVYFAEKPKRRKAVENSTRKHYKPLYMDVDYKLGFGLTIPLEAVTESELQHVELSAVHPVYSFGLSYK